MRVEILYTAVRIISPQSCIYLPLVTTTSCDISRGPITCILNIIMCLHRL
jgi:hypothetical protein